MPRTSQWFIHVLYTCVIFLTTYIFTLQDYIDKFLCCQIFKQFPTNYLHKSPKGVVVVEDFSFRIMILFSAFSSMFMKNLIYLSIWLKKRRNSNKILFSVATNEMKNEHFLICWWGVDTALALEIGRWQGMCVVRWDNNWQFLIFRWSIVPA